MSSLSSSTRDKDALAGLYASTASTITWHGTDVTTIERDGLPPDRGDRHPHHAHGPALNSRYGKCSGFKPTAAPRLTILGIPQKR